MKSRNTIEKYYEYRDKIGNRTGLYRIVAKSYDIASAIYPGSHIDIAPSLVIPKVIYVDNFKGTINFFKNIELIKGYIVENKEYEEPCDIVFMGQDYTKELNLEPVDLIISQYAGFVGQATKKYLKTGGILLCNDSHGDALYPDLMMILNSLESLARIIESLIRNWMNILYCPKVKTLI